MKQLILLISALAIIYANALSQGCLPQGIAFTTQTEIDNFQTNYPGYTVIEGDVIIIASNITNLNGLSVLTSIEGDLVIWDNPSLISLVGLENITSISGHVIIGGWEVGNPALTNLAGLDNLTYIQGDIFIGNNSSLNSLEGLENLTNLGGSLDIYHNFSLTSLTGLENLAYIGGGIGLYHNNSLTSLTGFENLTNLGGGLGIGEHIGLTSLTGLENLSSIGGSLWIDSNFSLTTLTGLDNLASLGGNLYITGNNSLTACESQWLCDYLIAPDGYVAIYNNSTGCNSVVDVAYACGGVPCLPYGNYDFLSQSDVDKFPAAFPGCTELHGHTTISGNDITDLLALDMVTKITGSMTITANNALNSLTGLDNLTSIYGSLDIIDNFNLNSLAGLEGVTYIGAGFIIDGNSALPNLIGLNNLASVGSSLIIYGNPSLNSLSGLESLISINGYLILIFNNSLNSLTGLESLNSISGELYISYNNSLSDLAGLENIAAGSITNLLIVSNFSLSTCHVQSICDYLAAPNGTVSISNNAPGCNSPAQVIEACEASGIEETIAENGFFISPNPFTGQLSIEFNLPQTSLVSIQIFNAMGAKVADLHHGQLPAGQQQITWYTGHLPKGMYFFRVQAGEEAITQKIIKVQ